MAAIGSWDRNCRYNRGTCHCCIAGNIDWAVRMRIIAFGNLVRGSPVRHNCSLAVLAVALGNHLLLPSYPGYALCHCTTIYHYRHQLIAVLDVELLIKFLYRNMSYHQHLNYGRLQSKHMYVCWQLHTSVSAYLIVGVPSIEYFLQVPKHLGAWEPTSIRLLFN
jgi:hypothetical protein